MPELRFDPLGEPARGHDPAVPAQHLGSTPVPSRALAGQHPTGARAPAGGGLAAVALFMVLLTGVMLWPLPLQMTTAARIDSDDGRFGVWNVAWVAHQLREDPTRLFDANIFFPEAGTLAYSEANLVAGFIGAPAYWLTANPVLAYNTVVWFAFASAGFTMFLLVRHLTGSTPGAVFAGVAFAFCPTHFSRLAHIQLLLSAGLPAGLLLFHRFAERRTPARALALGATVALQGLASAYLGVLLGLLLAVAAAHAAIQDGLWRDRRFWLGLTLAAGLAAAMVLPAFLPFMALKRDAGFERPLDEARRWSANALAFLTSSSNLHRLWWRLVPPQSMVLFPGILVTIIGAVTLYGCARGWRQPVLPVDGNGRRIVVLYSLVGLVSIWLSFGPDAGLYRLVYELLPPMTFLRAPSRWALGLTMALSVLAGLAVARASTRWGRRLPAILTALLVAELAVIPLPFTRFEPPPLAHRALRELPSGPVAVFPFWHRRDDYPKHTIYMLDATIHWQPLVNGYSDFIPPWFRILSLELSSGPTSALARLRERGVRYVIVCFDAYPAQERRRLREDLRRARSSFVPIVLGVTSLYELAAADALPPERPDPNDDN